MGLALAPLRVGRGWSGSCAVTPWNRPTGGCSATSRSPNCPPRCGPGPQHRGQPGAVPRPGLPPRPPRRTRGADGRGAAARVPARGARLRWWLDGGIIDILPSDPFVADDRCDLAIVVNGFYQPGFVSDREPRWRDSALSVLHVANQTRLSAHVRIARRNFDDLLRAVPDVIELAPVEYSTVQGAGLYGEFLDNRRWAGYMADGYHSATAHWPPGGRGPEPRADPVGAPSPPAPAAGSHPATRPRPFGPTPGPPAADSGCDGGLTRRKESEGGHHGNSFPQDLARGRGQGPGGRGLRR